MIQFQLNHSLDCFTAYALAGMGFLIVFWGSKMSINLRRLGERIVPTQSVQDLKIGVVTCPQCQHEFVKYTDERDLGIKQGGIPYSLFFKIVLSFLVGYVLYKINMYLLPEDAFDNPLSVLYTTALIIPSVVLFFALLAVLYMGLIYIWFYMVVTVSGLGVLVLLASLFINFAEAYLL
jgi:hypothetical protein